MADIRDFVPVIQENVNTIRARLEADVNAGIDPADPSFLDTTPGGFWTDLSVPFALEMERIYDVMGTDLPASMLPQYAWGAMLDELGAMVGVDRKDAAKAVGTVTFTGTVGTLIGTGVVVAVEQTDPSADLVAFETTESGTIPGGGTLALAVEATQAGAQGKVAVGQVSTLLSSVAAPDGSPGIASVTNADATSGGADIETDDKYRVRVGLRWSSARGGGTIGDYMSAALDWPGVGFVRVIPVYQSAGGVGVVITDDDNQPLGDEVVLALQNDLDPPYVTTALTVNASLPTATIHIDTTGFDTPNGRVRIGNDIVKYTGTTGSTLTGCTGGVGAYLIGEPVYGAGRGSGVAPIGAVVVVWSPTQEPINVAAAPTYLDGYSADGAGGTIAIGPDIEAALAAYLGSLAAGDDVVHARAVAAVVLVPGVRDMPNASLTLDSGGGPVTTNIAIDDNHAASPGTIVVT